MARLKLEPKYITDSRGVRAAVVLDIKQCKKSLDLVEEAEDAEHVKSVRNEPTRDYQEYRKRRLKSSP